eukprot:8259306-Ditylum_brightwellii.AAC.1
MVTWHVDDIKSSHVDSTVNDDFYHWRRAQYGSDLNGHVKVTRGKQHNYLGMILGYSEEEKLQVNMKYYIKDMLNEFSHNVKTTTKAPWNEKIFKVDNTKKKLDDECKALFHRFTMKAMFLCKCA